MFKEANLPRDIASDTQSHPVFAVSEAAILRRLDGLTWFRRGQTTSLFWSETANEVVREVLGGIALQAPCGKKKI